MPFQSKFIPFAVSHEMIILGLLHFMTQKRLLRLVYTSNEFKSYAENVVLFQFNFFHRITHLDLYENMIKDNW